LNGIRLAGPNRFRSALTLKGPDGSTLQQAEISVNHPLRFRGMTLYQADWTLAAIGVQLGRSPVLELPLQTFPQLGDQIWGIVLPTRPDGSQPVLLSLSSEQGPVTVFSSEAKPIASLVPGGDAAEIEGLPVRVDHVLTASGILLKRDPGVPLVYGGFGIALLGACSAWWRPASSGPSAIRPTAACTWAVSATATSRPSPGNCPS
jgi:cytochrome c biogenesis protein